MSDTGLGGVDFSLGLENLNTELATYFATPEGQASLAASGLAGLGDTATQPDFTQVVNDAYAPKYGYYTPDVGGTAGTGGGQEPVDPIALQMQQQLEFQQAQAAAEAQAAAQAEAEAKATAKAALLSKLGITAEEAQLLLA